MADRLIAMHQALKPTGSLYLHCDPTASHFLKLVLDAVFGSEQFKNELIWHYSKWSNTAGFFQRNHDVIFFYSRSEHYTFHPQYGLSHDKQKKLDKGFQVNKPDGVKQLIVYDREKAQAKIDEGEYDILVDHTQRNEGVALHDTWHDINIINSQAKERLGYPTQKPLKLLERIIRASSNEGDLIVDPFCGCGTTVHAAESLGRRWIGIDVSAFSVGLVKERLVTNFPDRDLHIETVGAPYDVATAKDLAQKDPFEFEKWVCGAIGAHGMFKDPGAKGRDGGVDGVIEFGLYTLATGPVKKEYAIVQVKGGKVTPDSVRALWQTVEDFHARAGIFVCFQDYVSTVEQNRKRGSYTDLTGSYPVIQSFSVEQLLQGTKPNLPPLVLRHNANLKQTKGHTLFDP